MTAKPYNTKPAFKRHILCAALASIPCVNTFANTPSNVTSQQMVNGAVSHNPDNAFPDYITAEKMATLPVLEQTEIPQGCRGVWVTPIPIMPSNLRIDKEMLDNANITSLSDYAYYDPNAGSVLTGNVVITQPERKIEADKITLDASQTHATAIGHVRVSSPGVTLAGEKMQYDLQHSQGSVSNSQFINTDRQAHGKAGQVTQQSATVTVLKDTEYSTCDPEHKTWNIKAKTLVLNKDTGRGVAKSSTLYVHDIPVFNLPYFDFPIDDRRATGFLVPSAGLMGSHALTFSAPYYINLAPNYDLTLKPTLISDRNPLLEGDFRYLTTHYGQGTLSGGYLARDVNYNHQDRERASLKHQWQVSPQTSTSLNLNYVSDKEYFVDFGNNPFTNNALYPERTLLINNTNSLTGLNLQLKVQDFQTNDKSVYTTTNPQPPDSDHPYTRLPQFLANYQHDLASGWQYKLNNDTGYFRKSITDGSATEDSGTRIYNHLAFNRSFSQPWGYFAPEIGVRTLSYYYNDASLISQNISPENRGTNVVVPQLTLDQGLTFERTTSKGELNTLEPRLMYSYAPVTSQNKLPNYDTTAVNFDYNQLFQPNRFVGHDRLEDNNFLSLGLVHRAYNQAGIEKYHLGIGEREFFEDRKTYVGSSPTFDQVKRSGPAFNAMWQVSPSIRLDASGLMSDNGRMAQTNTSIQYRPSQGNVFNLGYIDRNTYTGTTGFNQISTSFQTQVFPQWNILGYAQWDITTQKLKDGLLGFSYDACCWRVAMYSRSFYLDTDNLATASARNKIMFQLTLKGLAGLSGGQMLDLFRQKIAGYY